MKILVTGHRGFIGRNMVAALKDHEVTTFDWGGDLPTIKGLDWVIHLGAISATTERDVEKIMMQNYDFSRWLLDECSQNGVNMQYASSASVYGMGTVFTEDAPVDPRNPYAWSKYLFERYVRFHYYDHIHVQGFRYFNVYGPGEGDKGGQASPFEQFRRQAEETGMIKVFEGSDKYRRDFVPVQTVVDTHIKFFDVQETGVWNIGSGKTMTFREVAEQYNVPIEEIPMPEILKLSYQTYTCADMTKTNESLARAGK